MTLKIALKTLTDNELVEQLDRAISKADTTIKNAIESELVERVRAYHTDWLTNLNETPQFFDTYLSALEINSKTFRVLNYIVKNDDVMRDELQNKIK